MKGLLSFLLITVGAVGASIGAARTDTSVEGWVSTFQVQIPLTVASLVLLTAGVLLKVNSDRASRRTVLAHGGTLTTVRGAAAQVQTDLAGLIATMDQLDAETLHRRLDDLVNGPIDRFVENRNALIDAYGMGAYAEVMTEFATGERYLNRAWSASTDGYLEEATTYIRRALPLMQETTKRLSQLS